MLTFSYAESLLATKKKELEEMHKKLEKQAIEILTREEANYNISKQLRYWRSKAMSMEVSIFTFLLSLSLSFLFVFFYFETYKISSII